jgi:murein DD-endopeptidase MepM/ murein hydrolase activator NlpD
MSEGKVAYLASGSGVYGIYFYDYNGSPFTKVADTNTDIPSGSDKFSSFQHPAIDGDKVAFYGTGTGQEGIYLYNHQTGQLKVVVNENSTVPGRSETFSGFDWYPSISGEKIAFKGKSLLPGIYVSSPSNLDKVIKKGDVLDDRNVVNVYLGSEGLSGNQVAFRAYLSDASDAIFIATSPGPAVSGFDYPITYQPNNFGYRFLGEGNPGIHPGTDWNGENDNSGAFPVYASADGQIVAIDRTSWGGIMVIEHDYNGSTIYSQYGHVVPLEGLPNMSPGDDNPPISVNKGQQIATINPNPDPWLPHLHFEIRNSDHEDPTDPDYWVGGDYFTGELRWKIFLYYEEPKSFIMSHGDYSENQIQPIIVDSSKTFDNKDGSSMSDFIDENGVLTINVDGKDIIRHNFFVAWSLNEFNQGTLGTGENRGFGGNYHWAKTTNAGVATSVGDWYFRVLEAGYYKVEANIPYGHGTTAKAQYQVFHNGEVDYSYAINQNIVEGDLNERWVMLGVWYFSPEFPSRISLSNNTGEADNQIAFDAIRISPVTEPKPMSMPWIPLLLLDD